MCGRRAWAAKLGLGRWERALGHGEACLCGIVSGEVDRSSARGKFCNSIRERVSFTQQSCWPAWAGAPAGPAAGSVASGQRRFSHLSNGVIALSTSQGYVGSQGFAEPVVKPDVNASRLHVEWAPAAHLDVSLAPRFGAAVAEATGRVHGD